MSAEPLTVVAGVLTGLAGTFAIAFNGSARRYCFALTAIFAIVTCIGGVAWAREDDGKAKPSQSPPPSLSPSPSQIGLTATPTESRPGPITIDQVREVPLCARFTGGGDVPAGRTLWLTVLSDEHKYYFFDVIVNAARHRWTANNVTLGVPTEKKGEPFEILAVLSDDTDTEIIRSGKFLQGAPQLPANSSKEDQISVERSGSNKPCD